MANVHVTIVELRKKPGSCGTLLNVDTAVLWATKGIDERFPTAPLLAMMLAPRLRHVAGWPLLRKAMRLPDA